MRACPLCTYDGVLADTRDGEGCFILVITQLALSRPRITTFHGSPAHARSLYLCRNPVEDRAISDNATERKLYMVRKH